MEILLVGIRKILSPSGNAAGSSPLYQVEQCLILDLFLLISQHAFSSYELKTFLGLLKENSAATVSGIPRLARIASNVSWAELRQPGLKLLIKVSSAQLMLCLRWKRRFEGRVPDFIEKFITFEYTMANGNGKVQWGHPKLKSLNLMLGYDYSQGGYSRYQSICDFFELERMSVIGQISVSGKFLLLEKFSKFQVWGNLSKFQF